MRGHMRNVVHVRALISMRVLVSRARVVVNTRAGIFIFKIVDVHARSVCTLLLLWLFISAHCFSWARWLLSSYIRCSLFGLDVCCSWFRWSVVLYVGSLLSFVVVVCVTCYPICCCGCCVMWRAHTPSVFLKQHARAREQAM